MRNLDKLRDRLSDDEIDDVLEDYNIGELDDDELDDIIDDKILDESCTSKLEEWISKLYKPFIIASGALLIVFAGLRCYNNFANPDEHRYRRLQRHIETFQVEPSGVIVKDVIGDNLPERYVEKDGGRYFLEIDGKPVEEYLRQR